MSSLRNSLNPVQQEPGLLWFLPIHSLCSWGTELALYVHRMATPETSWKVISPWPGVTRPASSLSGV